MTDSKGPLVTPEGARIELVSMENDPDPIQPGTQGTVVHTDDGGTMHVQWDNGRFLGLVRGVDKWKVLNG